jgi:undecaprenyl-diphosphatase
MPGWVLGSREVYELSPLPDILLGSTALVLNGGALLGKHFRPEVTPPASFELDRVNSFDRWCALGYSRPADITSEALQWTAILAPALLLSAPRDDWLTIGVMYLESAALAYGAKELAKALAVRYRPYNYFSGRPGDALEDDDFAASFFSGHTTMAFNGAAFVSTVFCAYFADSPWKIPVIAGSFSLAAATGAARILAGQHFLSDVLIGALIGSAAGVVTPLLHRADSSPLNRRQEHRLSFSVLPGVVSAGLWL